MIITDHSSKAEAAKDDRVEESDAGAPPPYSGPSDYTQPSLVPQSSAAQSQAQQSFLLPVNAPAQPYQDPRSHASSYAGGGYNTGPNFAGYPGHPVPSPPSHTVPAHNVEGQPLLQNDRDSIRRARLRFLKTFAIAVGIYFLGVILVRSMVEVQVHHDGAPRGRGKHPPDHSHSPSGDWDLPGRKGSLSWQCTDVSRWPHSDLSQYMKGMTFELPLFAEEYFFLSTDTSFTGSVVLQASDQDNGPIHVDVIASPLVKEHIPEQVNVCYLETKGDKKLEGFQSGIAIMDDQGFYKLDFAPRKPRIKFDVVMKIPRQGFNITNLVIQLPNFSYSVLGLEEAYFEKLHLIAENGAINVEHISGRNITITSDNGGIKGSFESSDSLRLVTSNAPIDAVVTLHHDELISPQPSVDMINHNAPIKAKIGLHNTTDNPGSYQAFAQSSNGPIDIDFIAQPVNSHLSFTGTTTNGALEASVQPAYEGSYSLRTNNAAKVHSHPDAVDPSGGHRQRTRRSDRADAHRNQGWLWWGKSQPSSGGEVTLRTTNGPVIFNI